MSEPLSSPLPGSSAVRGGWICFGIGLAITAISNLLFVFYAPLFVASFILGIVAIALGRTSAGVAILLCTLILPFLVNIYAPGFLGAILGVHVAAGGG